MAGRLENKVALITGGSSGIGLATAELFVEQGATVYITGRRQEALDAAVARVGKRLRAVVADSARIDDVHRLFDTLGPKRVNSMCCSQMREQGI